MGAGSPRGAGSLGNSFPWLMRTTGNIRRDSTLFVRCRQRCGLLLSVLQQLVCLAYLSYTPGLVGLLTACSDSSRFGVHTVLAAMFHHTGLRCFELYTPAPSNFVVDELRRISTASKSSRLIRSPPSHFCCAVAFFGRTLHGKNAAERCFTPLR